MLRSRHFAVAAVMLLAAGQGLAKDKDESMNYKQTLDALSKKTKLVELVAGDARVMIAPEWQGRVMTSTCAGPEGTSFGFVNHGFINAGKLDARFNNYGGEERFWLSPEGGPFSLWFKPGVEQVLANWHTAPAMNEGAWKVTSKPRDPFCTMQQQMKLQNTAGTNFTLDVTRTVRLVDAAAFGKIFGAEAGKLVAGTKLVGYETANEIVNRGEPMDKKKGLVSIWLLGMMESGPETVVIVPYKPGSEAELGPVVKSDYFGAIPPDRLKVLPEAILFKADANFRSKIGTSQRRAKNVLGSIDFRNNALSLVAFNMPADPTKCDYMNNMWGKQGNSYSGDVANSYNDGKPEKGEQLGSFYEIESLSPAKTLKTGDKLAHVQQTIHIQANPATLAKLAKAILGVDLEKVKQEMGK